MLQMILMIFVATPILIVNSIAIPVDSGFQFFDPGFQVEYPIKDQFLLILGVIMALFGLLFEMITDYQLKEFIKIKKPGEIFTTGLYRYSRHPNYFGESMFWLGISMIGLTYSYFAIIGWLVITFLLLFVSGVPLQEARYAGRPNWEAYKKKTSVFIPWFPKK